MDLDVLLNLYFCIELKWLNLTNMDLDCITFECRSSNIVFKLNLTNMDLDEEDRTTKKEDFLSVKSNQYGFRRNNSTSINSSFVWLNLTNIDLDRKLSDY